MGEPNHIYYCHLCINIKCKQTEIKSSSTYQIRPYDNTIKLRCTILALTRAVHLPLLILYNIAFILQYSTKNKAVGTYSHRLPFIYNDFVLFFTANKPKETELELSSNISVICLDYGRFLRVFKQRKIVIAESKCVFGFRDRATCAATGKPPLFVWCNCCLELETLYSRFIFTPLCRNKVSTKC